MSKFYSFFLLFTLFISIGAPAADVNSMEAFIKDCLIIQQSLEKENKNFFFSRFMCLEPFKNCPEAIPTLAQALDDEWHFYEHSLIKEKIIQSFRPRLNNNILPLTFVILKNKAPIAAISLKNRAVPEFLDFFSKNCVWMESLQILLEEKNQGLDEKLLSFVCNIAKELGYNTLYFYTSNPENVKRYLKRGAKLLEKGFFKGRPVILLQISLEI